MEKLLEVLIAIGDEVACLSVTEIILRHWPSHSRAIHVKQVIVDSEPTPFAPRGIDKLEPQHVRLKFLDKRKATNHDLDDNGATKRSNRNTILDLPKASWTALAGELLGILIPLNECDPRGEANELHRSADIRLTINLPCSSDNVSRIISNNPSKDNEAVEHASTETSLNEEPHQERRSSRLERLRSRKPEKEEPDLTVTKDLVKLVPQFLEPFIMVESGTTNCSKDTSASSRCSEVMTNAQNNESTDVARFVHETSKNYGAYHIGHLLLEEIACRGIPYRDSFEKFLELEQLTRNSGENRTPECSIFLAELSYDFGIRSSDPSTSTDFMSRASYHLCKLIEAVALDYPFDCSGGMPENNTTDGFSIGYLLDKKRALWVRFFWLSGKLSIFNDDKEKAQKEFGVALALFTAKDKESNPLVSISLPHLKVINELTVDWVLHELNLLEVDFLMKNSVSDMIEKNLHLECVNLLAPLLFCMKDDHAAVSAVLNKDSEGVTSAELSALNVLIKACERSKQMDAIVYLRCHRRKLQLLMSSTGVEECFGSQKLSTFSKPKVLAASETELTENSSTVLHPLLSEEVKAISQCTLEMRNSISPCGSIVS